MVSPGEGLDLDRGAGEAGPGVGVALQLRPALLPVNGCYAPDRAGGRGSARGCGAWASLFDALDVIPALHGILRALLDLFRDTRRR